VFFDLGHDHYYYDDYTNESIMRKVADKCYLPANKIILDLIQKNKGKFKVAFSLSGIAINQFRLYAPEVLESFRQLAETGMVEFLAETDSHSLASLKSKVQFENQVNIHREMMRNISGSKQHQSETQN
jgi:alpha-amylase